jgi:hypothetical protein
MSDCEGGKHRPRVKAAGADGLGEGRPEVAAGLRLHRRVHPAHPLPRRGEPRWSRGSALLREGGVR